MYVDATTVEGLISAIGEDGVVELFDAYVVSTQDIVTQFNKAYEEDDINNMRFYGHRLKGSSGTLGLTKMQQLGKEIETFSMAKDIDSAKAYIEHVEKEFKETISQLKSSYPNLL